MIQVNDLSRSLAAFDPISTLVVVVEMSKASWLVSSVVPGVERQPLPRAQTWAAVRRAAPARRDGPRDRPTPSVYLMDEPLSNLDAKLRVQMRADIAALQSKLGATTVYVTHARRRR